MDTLYQPGNGRGNTEFTAKETLYGHTIIDMDLNKGAGDSYIYMGYKTTTDPDKAITGIVFSTEEDPADSITYGGCTFYLVGGQYGKEYLHRR